MTGELEDDLWNATENGTQADVDAVIEQYGGVHGKTVGDTDFYTVWEDEAMVVEVGENYADAKPFGEWIYDSWTWDGMSDFLGYDVREQFHEDFYQHESTTSHATTEESAANIIASGGLHPRNKTRGMGNQSVGSAVFTTTSAGDWLNVYGDAVFQIDVEKMRQNGYTPRVEPEPEVAEVQEREAVAHMMNVDDFWAELPPDVDQSTAIINGEVPLEYLSLDASEESMDAIAQTIDRLEANGDIQSERAERARAWLDAQRGDASGKADTAGVPAPELKATRWVRYEGPRGGEGWRNPSTGEIRYQREKPGSDESGGSQQTTPEPRRGNIFGDDEPEHTDPGPDQTPHGPIGEWSEVPNEALGEGDYIRLRDTEGEVTNEGVVVGRTFSQNTGALRYYMRTMPDNEPYSFPAQAPERVERVNSRVDAEIEPPTPKEMAYIESIQREADLGTETQRIVDASLKRYAQASLTDAMSHQILFNTVQSVGPMTGETAAVADGGTKYLQNGMARITVNEALGDQRETMAHELGHATMYGYGYGVSEGGKGVAKRYKSGETPPWESVEEEDLLLRPNRGKPTARPPPPKMKRLISTVNDTFLRAKRDTQNGEDPWQTGLPSPYSITNASEWWAHIHEGMQTEDPKTAMRVAGRVMTRYPEIDEAYREVYQPSPLYERYRESWRQSLDRGERSEGDRP